MKSYTKNYLQQSIKVIEQLPQPEINKAIQRLMKLKKQKGRLFLLGVGGSAANCSHAVNDFRKIAGIETYTPVDNVSELTARTNDDGWETIFVNWLKTNKLKKKDTIMVFSVGGGDLEKKTSVNIVEGIKYGKEIGASIVGIVSRDGGFTKTIADICILIPVVEESLITPLAESLQALVWHLMAVSPELKN